WRCRRRLADMEARHGAEKVRAGDALHRRVDRGKRVDQADRDIVAIDVVALGGSLPVWPGDDGRSFARWIEQRRSERRGVGGVLLKRHDDLPWVHAYRGSPGLPPPPPSGLTNPGSCCPIRSAWG